MEYRKLIGTHAGVSFTIAVGDRFIEKDDGLDHGVVTKIVQRTPGGAYVIETDKPEGTGALVGAHEVSFRE